jgi:sigma-B regulation protein RsbU (phosphoserine phosphatase)
MSESAAQLTALIPPDNLSTETKFHLLQEITRKISGSLDLDEVLSLIIDSVKSFVPYDSAAIYVLETNGRDRRIRANVHRGYDAEPIERLLKIGEGFVGWVIQHGSGIIISDVRNDTRYIRANEFSLSEIVVPIVANNRIIGAFNLESQKLDAYNATDLEVLTFFATTAAISIEKALLHQERLEKRRLESELAVARQVQRSLLPDRDPQIDGFDISGLTVSCEEVSGDYYDFIEFPNHQLGVAIADVSGKGIPAALIMASFRASLRAQARNEFAIRNILRKVNYLLWESIASHQYVTAIYGVLDPHSGRFSFGDAGHNPLIIMRSDGSYTENSCGNIVLGIFEEREYKECYRRLRQGDLVALYTDGVTEATRDGVEFGVSGFIETLRKLRNRPARDIARGVYATIKEYTGKTVLDDDMTVVIIKCLKNSSEPAAS